jgi:hypothetical protein
LIADLAVRNLEVNFDSAIRILQSKIKLVCFQYILLDHS